MKDRMKRICGAALVVCMTVSLCACGASEKAEKEAVAETATEEVDVLQDAMEEEAIDSHSDENGKETTVYVLTDANGSVNNTIVSEWLKNGDGANTIVDKSTLQDIENTKDDADYTSNSDGTITWNTEGKDVYYRGTTKEELPVDVDIKYELNNKEVTADELAGASGHLRITFTYKNKQEKDYIIKGKPCKIYQPYMMLSGVLLDHDKASGIKVDKGKVIDTGDASVAMGMAMPGLSESLNLDELTKDSDSDINIPENVVIEADVKDFSMMAAMTFASNDLLSELGLDDVDSVDDLEDSLDELDDAANQLVDGTKELADGTKDLKNGTSDLKDGSSKLADGTQDLDAGVSDLQDGADLISEKMKELQSGSKSLSAGLEEIKNGAAVLDGGLNQLNQKVAALPAATEDLQTNLTKVSNALNTIASSGITGASLENPDEVTNKMAAAEGKVDKAEENLQKVIGNLSEEQLAALGEDNVKLIKDAEAALNEAGEQLDDTSKDTEKALKVLDNTAASQLLASINQVNTSLQQIVAVCFDEQTGLVAQSNTLTAAVGQLTKGADSLAAGTKSASDGAAKLDSGAGQLADGASTLSSGAKTLKKGSSQLADGAGDLDDGVSKLADGAKQLLDGSNELKNGMQEFYSDGICELTDLMEEDLVGTYDRLRAVKSFRESQEAFGGCADHTDCTVKYVYKSDQIGDIDE